MNKIQSNKNKIKVRSGHLLVGYIYNSIFTLQIAMKIKSERINYSLFID